MALGVCWFFGAHVIVLVCTILLTSIITSRIPVFRERFGATTTWRIKSILFPLLFLLLFFSFQRFELESRVADGMRAAAMGVASVFPKRASSFSCNAESIHPPSEYTFETNLILCPSINPSSRLSEALLGGLLGIVQKFFSIEVYLAVICLGMLIISIVILTMAYLFTKDFSSSILYAAIVTSIFLSLAMALRNSSGWDELFVNLMHSFNFAQFGSFSYRVHPPTEGTVDFLPYFLVGLLGKVGAVRSIDAILILTLLGNVLVIVSGTILTFLCCRSKMASAAVALILGLLPSLWNVGATGFTAGIFTGLILVAFCLYQSGKIKSSYAVFSILTLVRTEGSLFLLVWAGIQLISALLSNHKDKGKILRSISSSLIVASVPFLITLLVRYFYFGYPVPNPITFKNTSFDIHYMIGGFVKLMNEMIFTNLDLILGTLAMMLFLLWKNKLSQFKILLTMTSATFIFVLPYFIGGGDWFPQNWTRYIMPLIPVSVVCAYAAITLLLKHKLEGSKGAKGLIAFSYCSLAFFFFFRAPLSQENLLSTSIDTAKRAPVLWTRIDSLSQMGLFLKSFLPSESIIASPEEATIMYFAERSPLGLLGTTTPSIAQTPLDPFNSNPGFADGMHRKRNPNPIKDERPEVIVLWEPAMEHNIDLSAKSSIEKVQEFSSNFLSQAMIEIGAYRAGSARFLVEAGYQHNVVFINNYSFSFWLHKKAAAGFESFLLKNSPTIASIYPRNISYPRHLVERFCDPKL